MLRRGGDHLVSWLDNLGGAKRFNVGLMTEPTDRFSAMPYRKGLRTYMATADTKSLLKERSLFGGSRSDLLNSLRLASVASTQLQL